MFAAPGAAGKSTQENMCDYVWPAQHADVGYIANPYLPEGAIFRFPASLNLDAYDLSPYARMVANAIQTYGMVLTDRASNVAFYAEDYRTYPGLSDPYGGTTGIFDNLPNNGSGLFRNFPWGQLVMIAPQGTPEAQGCG
jgi:hypothetical protein